MSYFTCDECRQPIKIHAVVDSEVWEQIADGAYALCPPCMDARMVSKGIAAECDLQFVGQAMRCAQTPRIVRAGAWRPPEFITRSSVGLPGLFRDRA